MGAVAFIAFTLFQIADFRFQIAFQTSDCISDFRLHFRLPIGSNGKISHSRLKSQIGNLQSEISNLKSEI